MVAIALAFGALTLGAPTQKAAASLAQKNPTKSGINLAAPFWGNDHGNDDDSTWTNGGVDCPATRVTSGDADKVKDMMQKLTARPKCSVTDKGGDPCDPASRKLQFECGDKDGSGTITTKEVEDALVADGAPKEMAAMVVGIFDENGDGTITAKEFNDAMVCMMSAHGQPCTTGGNSTGSAGQTGEDVCENKGFDPSECSAVGCCQYDDGQCWSAVGAGPCTGGNPTGGNSTGSAGQTGEDVCENKGFDPSECSAVGCCQYDDGQCWSAVGAGLCTSPCKGGWMGNYDADGDGAHEKYMDGSFTRPECIRYVKEHEPTANAATMSQEATDTVKGYCYAEFEAGGHPDDWHSSEHWQVCLFD